MTPQPMLGCVTFGAPMAGFHASVEWTAPGDDDAPAGLGKRRTRRIRIWEKKQKGTKHAHRRRKHHG